MSGTFEEIISEHMDHLYHGAVFMTGGDEEDAEQLLLEVAGTGFRRFAARQPRLDPRRWLEGLLVERLMARASMSYGGRPVGPRARDPLLAAVGTLPSSARAALWLTVLCRWSYRATARQLSLDGGELSRLLEARSVLYSALSGARMPKNGTEA